MSDFRFGADDYKLNYYPSEASDGWGGVDWDKVECVEIDWVKFVRERTCVPHGEWERLSQTQVFRRMYCDCGYELGIDRRDSFPFERTTYAPMPRFCPECGARIVSKGKVVKR